MKKGKVHIIFGTGMGKTAMALGRGVSAAMHGRKVIMIQFLKGVLSHETADGLKQLELAFKVFRFEKQNEYYENLSEEGKKEELCNIQERYNFAKKVLWPQPEHKKFYPCTIYQPLFSPASSK